jgi:lipopolysaccharide transport system permease protein
LKYIQSLSFSDKSFLLYCISYLMKIYSKQTMYFIILSEIMINPHQKLPTGIDAMILSLWTNRQLIVQMTKREILGRYRGSKMGLVWSFLNPLLMLIIYTFIFSEIFNAKWGLVANETKIDFAIILFAGLIIHGLLAECLNRAPSLILENVEYVKKVVFPLEVLPWISMGSALFHTTISLIILISANLIFNQQLPWTILLFPLILLPLVLTTIGFAMALASLGVYIRNIGQIVSIFTLAMLFVSPIFYPISALPEEYQTLIHFNPLTFILEEGRKSLIFGLTPDWMYLGVAMLIGAIIAWGGFWWFQKTRKGFADVL